MIDNSCSNCFYRLDAGTGPSNAAELELLRKQLAERLAENQRFIEELSLSWEEKLKVTVPLPLHVASMFRLFTIFLDCATMLLNSSSN